jgi:hypothetical protein
MPYFNTDSVHILLVHIPKTGGTSLETYFSHKYSLPLDESVLFSSKPSTIPEFKNRYIQHLCLSEYEEHKDILHIDFNSLTIYAITRNPYDRLISALLYERKITLSSDLGTVYSAIYDKLTAMNISNRETQFRHYGHYVPQWVFICDASGTIDPRVIVLDTDTLTSDMIAHGFTDFRHHNNGNLTRRTEYRQLLSSQSIDLINTVYERDFTLFKYPMATREHQEI